jgi:hypothetical protein
MYLSVTQLKAVYLDDLAFASPPRLKNFAFDCILPFISVDDKGVEDVV